MFAALILAACGGDGDVRVVGEDGSEVVVTEEPGGTGAPGEGDGTSTPAAETPAPTASETPTSTPEATPTAAASPTSTPGAPTGTPTGEGGATSGPPYSTPAISAAIEGAGRTFEQRQDVAAICADTAVGPTIFTSAASAGAADSTTWALWTYPDVDAREDDWDVDDGRLEADTDDCELPSGFNYYNANAVLVFLESEGSVSPRNDPVVEVFLALGASGAGDGDDDGGR